MQYAKHWRKGEPHYDHFSGHLDFSVILTTKEVSLIGYIPSRNALIHVSYSEAQE